VNKFHTPVLLNETIEFLKVEKNHKYIDATLGGGGHTEKILERGGYVLGIDCDLEAIKFCADKFGLKLEREGEEAFAYGERIILVWQNFIKIKKVATKFGFVEVDGILFDLGVSSHQLSDSRRGFSFEKEGPLDMRMDQRLNVTASDLINSLSRRQLEDLLKKFGQEKHYRAIARTVESLRLRQKIKTTSDLAGLIEKTVKEKNRLHPATQVFMALRIAVNSELENLKLVLPQAADLLKIGGRLAVISFHSLEDRIVKQFFRENSSLQMVTKNYIKPSEIEVTVNRRSRSAKLRVAEKVN